MRDFPLPNPDDPTVPLGSSAPGARGASIDPQAEAPSSIGAYPILRELGRGGMGVVYLARDPRLERDVALKLLPPELDSDSEARERFLGEARTLAALNHPNIATIYSLDDDAGGRHFLTMELIEGATLGERLRQGSLPIEETLSVMRQVARAVEAAHSKGVVHRDLKPSNVMIQDDGTVKVLDFGLALRLQIGSIDSAEIPQAARGMAGTPGYMSPEQVLGEAVDRRTDVWAVGCLLYECLSGGPLIRGKRMADKLAATMRVDAGSVLDALWPEPPAPARLALLLRRCLSLAAEDRFASIRDVRFLIEEETAERALPHAAPDDRPVAPEVRAVPGNLPRRFTSFVGRRRDLQETARLFDEQRMVTITGAGGCGKTRLSLELAARMAGAFPDGMWMVELAPLADPALVPASAAAALGAHQAPGTGALDALLRFVGEKRILIVLDNCEHLVETCADLAERLLQACPHVGILATSRESLRVEGEAVYALAPLGLPKPGPSTASLAHTRDEARPASINVATAAGSGPGESEGAGDIDGSEAVRLFVDRARFALPAFRLDEENRAAIHEICRRLDGIPLAIELAAARVKSLPVEKIRDLLDDRFRLLTRGSRTAQPHQATLRALIDWSYDRLEAREQAVFRRLSVFRGAWALDGVEAVAAGGDVEEWDVLDLFTRLVEKSLVVRDIAAESAGSARYYMFETVRAYAREKLHASAQEEPLALRRHRDYVVALSLEGENGLRGRDQARWGGKLADAVDDVRSVLELTAREPDGAEAGLLLAGSFWLYWYNHGMWQEGSEAIARALAHPAADREGASFGRALVAAGNLAYRMGDLERSWKFQQDALPVLTGAGTDVQVGAVHLNLGNIAYSRGDYDEAQRAWEASLDCYRRANSTVWIAGCLTNLSALALAREDIDRLETLQSEALRIYEAAGIRDNVCLCLFQLGIAALVRDDFDLSRARYDRALAIARELDLKWNTMAALINIAALELKRGRPEETLGPLVECLSRLKDTWDPVIALPVIETIAGLKADAHPAASARILAAATALRARLTMAPLSYEADAFRSLEARLTEALGEEEAARAREAGGRLSLEDALSAAEALLEGVR